MENAIALAIDGYPDRRLYIYNIVLNQHVETFFNNEFKQTRSIISEKLFAYFLPLQADRYFICY